MKITILQSTLLAWMVSLGANLSAQTDEWKTALSKNGKITAKYNFSSRINEDDDKVPVVKTITTTTESIGIDNCIALMKNIAKHKDFRGEKSSKLINKISENEWSIYYYNDGMLLTPAVDGSYRMIFEEDRKNKTATFTLTADPTLIEKTDMARLTYAKEIYSFKEVEGNQLEITIKTTVSPGFKVPFLMMKKAFPRKSFEHMEKFLEAAKKEKP
ncbi:hypothetical protein [Petrimonas sulfuriphila]|jgi:hypothetical protein|uniref:hypothetical protein n=1 Tax=Petrimonas sulfuriphila TaxID=285070 RepID=UPI002D102148|nr:hypothetical protein [Petrimonas sp.]